MSQSPDILGPTKKTEICSVFFFDFDRLVVVAVAVVAAAVFGLT